MYLVYNRLNGEFQMTQYLMCEHDVPFTVLRKPFKAPEWGGRGWKAA